MFNFKKTLVSLAAAATMVCAVAPCSASAVSQAKSLNLPSGYGKLTSNAWRGGQRASGNTYQWDYQVSAVYTGSKKVKSIRATWVGSASLRNSASISLGCGDSVSVGAGSSWQYKNTVSKYWVNTNGAKTSSYRSNMYVTPSRDYRSNTISIANTAKVEIKGDPRSWSINASC